jgi:hypothetical protein
VSDVVVDTNVVLVANGQHGDVSPDCVATCAKRLQAVMQKGKLALDDGFLILSEYQNKTKSKVGKGSGDAFVKWALQNNANPHRVERVALLEHAGRGFASFPNDAALANFDPSGRKFVAVAAAHPQKPPILQATDSKWLNWEKPLRRHGITVEFLCRNDIARFKANKSKP